MPIHQADYALFQQQVEAELREEALSDWIVKNELEKPTSALTHHTEIAHSTCLAIRKYQWHLEP